MIVEQINYEVSGIKYLLFECDLNDRSYVNFIKKIERFKGIMQSAKKTNGFWSETIVTVKVLIPEINAISFTNFD